jgi:hypothetical protein
VKDVDKHVNVSRNIYYGGHHFLGAGNWRGPRPAARAGGPGFGARTAFGALLS